MPRFWDSPKFGADGFFDEVFEPRGWAGRAQLLQTGIDLWPHVLLRVFSNSRRVAIIGVLLEK